MTNVENSSCVDNKVQVILVYESDLRQTSQLLSPTKLTG